MLYGREMYRTALPLTEEDAKLDINTVGRTLNKNYLAKLAQHLTKETGVEWSPPNFGTSSDKWSKQHERKAYFSAQLGGGGRIAIRLDVHLRNQLNVYWITETSGTAHQRTIAHLRLENLTIADLKNPSKLFPPAEMKQIKDAITGSTETEEKYVLEGVNEVLAELAQLNAQVATLRNCVQRGVLSNGLNLAKTLEDVSAYAHSCARSAESASKQLDAALKIKGVIKQSSGW